MIRHITRIGLLITVIAILIVIVLNHSNDDETKVTTDSSTHASHVQLKNKIPSPYKQIHLIIDSEKTKSYTVQVMKPVTTSETINQEIESWLETEKQLFIQSLPEDTKELASLKVNVSIEPETKQYQRLIFQIDKSINQKGTELKKVFNIDLEAEKMLSLDDFLDINDSLLQTFLKHGIELLQVEDDITLSENSQQSILSSTNNWEWFMSQEGLTFIFDGTTLTDDNNHPLLVTIPFKALYLHIHDSMNQYVELSEKQQEERKMAIEEEEQRILIAKREAERKAQEKAEAERQQSESTSNVKGKYVALTFDDGPSAEVTPRVLEILKQYNAKATFFMLGSQVSYHPEIAKRVADAGHEIGNHTEQHQDLTKLGPDGIRREINSTSDKIANVTGVRPYLVRPPYGAHNENVRHVAANQGDSIILWSVDSLDWKSRNAAAINREIGQQLTSGAIVLMHDIHPTTADALPELMKTLHQQGYQFVTVSQLLKIQGLSGVGPIYGSSK